MGEAIQLATAKGRLRSQAEKPLSTAAEAHGCPASDGASGRASRTEAVSAPLSLWGAARLLSPLDAAISRRLQEHTRMVLATLMPHEEQLLRMRFGIGEPADHTRDEIGRILALSRERILEIESRALRKLRRPNRVVRLSGTGRI